MLCSYHEKCPMYTNQICLDYPTLAEKLKEKYCEADFESCARKCVRDTLGKDFVPQMMLPQQNDWARQILSDNGISISQINQLLDTPRKA